MKRVQFRGIGDNVIPKGELELGGPIAEKEIQFTDSTQHVAEVDDAVADYLTATPERRKYYKVIGEDEEARSAEGDDVQAMDVDTDDPGLGAGTGTGGRGATGGTARGGRTGTGGRGTR